MLFLFVHRPVYPGLKDFKRGNVALKHNFMWPYAHTSIFSVALWAAPLIEGSEGTLEIALQP